MGSYLETGAGPNGSREEIVAAIRKLGERWRAKDFTLDERAKQTDELLASVPSEVEEWLQEPVGEGENRRSRLLILLGGGTLTEKETGSQIARQNSAAGGSTSREKRRRSSRRRRYFLSHWLTPSA